VIKRKYVTSEKRKYVGNMCDLRKQMHVHIGSICEGYKDVGSMCEGGKAKVRDE
jgi:hypothetical protein